ncbi:LuxR C-terminal-related transcriptional regulator [Arthrobacter sp. TMN-37]
MTRIQEDISLVGRAQMVEDILTALRTPAGFGAMVVGEPGVGKTALARAVVGRVNGSTPVFSVTGGSSLRHIPFGALAPYLHGLAVGDAGSPVAILRSMMKHLPESRGRTQDPPLFVVDDAHELDESTCALLAQLVGARRAKLLVLSRATPQPPAEFAALGRDGLLARFDLEPLDAPAVDELCRQALGGNVLTGTSNLLAATTGGNPLFLLTLLKQGPGQGYLVERNGVWRMVGGRPAVNLRLVDLIQGQLRQRSSTHMAALEAIALAEPIAFQALSSCTDPDALQRLQDDRLITVGPAPDRLVALAHPLYSEVIRTVVPAARSIAIRRAVLEVLDPRTESLEGFLRSVAWGLDCGVPPEDQRLLRAAVVANRLNDPGFALRAARAVSAPGLRGRALVEIARAQVARGNLSYARELIDEALLRCTDLLVAEEATLLSFDIRLRAGGTYEELRGDIERWESLISAVGSTGSGALRAAVATSYLGARLLRCHLLLLEGRLTGLEGPLREVVADPHGSPETRTGSLVLLGELLGASGRPRAGAACTAEALAIIAAEEHRLLTYREFAVSRHLMCLIHAADWDEARSVLRDSAPLSPRDPGFLAGWSDLVEGIAALRSGKTGAARDRLLLAVEGIRESDGAQVLTMAIGMASFACAAAADTARAKALIDEYGAVPRRGSRQMRLTGRIYTLAAAARLGEADQAADALSRIAESAASDGMLEVASAALEEAARLGDSAATASLAALTTHFEGREAAVLHAWAGGRCDRDPVRLASAAGLAEENGYLPIAADCLRAAAELWSAQGAAQKARSAHSRLSAVLSGTDQPTPAGTNAGDSGTRLTPREVDIVSLVAEGYSNREIAERQGVSVRTVEGHLYRIFAKLGVSRREELQHQAENRPASYHR